MENFDHSNLTGKQLLLFLSVYDTNSVSKAAEQLDLNQSTVSYGLDKLREAFDDLLFVKSGRGIVPTDRAIAIAPAIRSILQDLEGLAKPTDYSPNHDDREIVIAANVMELLPVLQEFYQELCKQAPLAPFKFLELGSRENIRELLNQNIVDMIVSIKHNDLPNSLKAETLYRSEIVCYYDANVRDPINNIDDFVKAEHAALDFGGSSKSTIDLLLQERMLQRKIMFRVPNAFALGVMIRGTPFITSMQKSLAGSALAGLAHCPHPLDVPEAVFDLVWHRKNDTTPRNIWLRKTIRSKFYDYIRKSSFEKPGEPIPFESPNTIKSDEQEPAGQ